MWNGLGSHWGHFVHLSHWSPVVGLLRRWLLLLNWLLVVVGLLRLLRHWLHAHARVHLRRGGRIGAIVLAIVGGSVVVVHITGRTDWLHLWHCHRRLLVVVIHGRLVVVEAGSLHRRQLRIHHRPVHVHAVVVVVKVPATSHLIVVVDVAVLSILLVRLVVVVASLTVAATAAIVVPVASRSAACVVQQILVLLDKSILYIIGASSIAVVGVLLHTHALAVCPFLCFLGGGC